MLHEREEFLGFRDVLKSMLSISWSDADMNHELTQRALFCCSVPSVSFVTCSDSPHPIVHPILLRLT